MSRTYISLFSCAGVGCYGFKMAGFECIATNELLEPRLEIQRVNHKCKYESGYICGDATAPETHKAIFDEIDVWKKKEGLKQVDVVFATPPCQGMSTANYKKNDHEQIRNSLVVEAIKMINAIRPKIFVFENVRAFLTSTCTDISGKDMEIKQSILKNLSGEYNIYWKVINFKDYGVPSSRPRTIVIGTSKMLKHITPLQLFPTQQEEILLKDSIGHFARLNYCEKDKNDPLHFARPFPEYMLDWIKNLKEGETAFDNPDETKPYTINSEGNRVINKGAYMGNKYRRLIWNRPGACIATRSDVMSSQDTIHPCDNRVLSIRELMTLMTIPNTFKWTAQDDNLTVENSEAYLKANECNIRRCIGEAVPTHIGYSIALKASTMLDYEDYMEKLVEPANVKSNFYIQAKKMGFVEKSAITYSTINNIANDVIDLNIKFDSVNSFISAAQQLDSYYSHVKDVNLDFFDLDAETIKNVKKLLKLLPLGAHTTINFLTCKRRNVCYDICVEKNKCFQTVPCLKSLVAKSKGNPDQLSLF